MPKIDAIRFSCYTSLYLFIYTLSIMTYLTGNLFSIVFFQFKLDDWVLLGTIIGSSTIIYGFLTFFKEFLGFIHKKWGIGGYEQCRNEILVGLIGIFICGVTPRIMVYWVHFDEFTIFFSLNIFIITAILIGLLFINQFNEDYKFTYSLKDRTSWIMIILHTVILLATVPLDLQTWQRTTVIQLCHLTFFPMCTSTTVEILKVLNGDLRLSNSKKPLKYAGINGLWERLKSIRIHEKVAQKSETWPEIGVFRAGLEDGITVMTRWTAPELQVIEEVPVAKDTVERKSPEAPSTSSERTVTWME